MKKQSLAACTAAALAIALAIPAGVNAATVATVNDVAIPQAKLDALLAQYQAQAQRTGQQIPEEAKDQIREELVAREVFRQEAQRQGLEQSDRFKTDLELLREQLLAGALFEKYQEDHPISDDEVRAEYDEMVAAQAEQFEGGKEYKASHILVETEDEAKDLIKQLDDGAKFDKLARDSSKDPGSAEKGGDLGWAMPDRYVPEFGNALKELDKGAVTQTPIKSQFGYHIIKLDDTRDAEAPPAPDFDDVKEQLRQQMMQQQLSAYQHELIEKADVK